MSIHQRICDELAAIEAQENLTILLAIESGSRAWGFASPDSDYDVRFIYVRRRDDYLRLDERRDVCEWCLNETLDINGWDFDKTLRLLRTSNPTLFEWMNSPIVYHKHPAFDSLMADAGTFFRAEPTLYHYLHMAERSYREQLQRETVKLKKYFYVLRPILACRHILRHASPPPMLFGDLVKEHLPAELLADVQALLRLKESTSEMGVGPKQQRVHDFIEQSLHELRAEVDNLPTIPKGDWDQLNDVFLRALSVTGRIGDKQLKRWYT